MFGAFDPARLCRPCNRATNSTEAPITNMVHAGHCRGSVASAQVSTTPPRSGELWGREGWSVKVSVSTLRPRRGAGAEEQAVSSRKCCTSMLQQL